MLGKYLTAFKRSPNLVSSEPRRGFLVGFLVKFLNSSTIRLGAEMFPSSNELSFSRAWCSNSDRLSETGSGKDKKIRNSKLIVTKFSILISCWKRAVSTLEGGRIRCEMRGVRIAAAFFSCSWR